MSASTPLSNSSLNDNQTPRLIRIVIACSVLAGLALVDRLIARKMLRSKLLLSDYVVMAALGTAWVLSAVTLHCERFFSTIDLDLLLIHDSGNTGRRKTRSSDINEECWAYIEGLLMYEYTTMTNTCKGYIRGRNLLHHHPTTCEDLNTSLLPSDIYGKEV